MDLGYHILAMYSVWYGTESFAMNVFDTGFTSGQTEDDCALGNGPV